MRIFLLPPDPPASSLRMNDGPSGTLPALDEKLDCSRAVASVFANSARVSFSDCLVGAIASFAGAGADAAPCDREPGLRPGTAVGLGASVMVNCSLAALAAASETGAIFGGADSELQSLAGVGAEAGAGTAISAISTVEAVTESGASNSGDWPRFAGTAKASTIRFVGDRKSVV